MKKIELLIDSTLKDEIKGVGIPTNSIRKKGFKKGVSGNKNGRPKGSINMRTKIINAFTEGILQENIPAFRKNLRALKGRDHVNAIIALLDFSIPRQQRTEFKGESINVNVDVEKEYFEIGGRKFEL